MEKCRKCGADLIEEALEGLCHRCLGRLAFNLSEPGGSETPNVRGWAFGDYELIEEIARGGMGVVYKANQKRLNRLVALKMILHGPFASPEFVRRFQTEAETIARLQHPNIVTIHEVGQRDGHHYISMEYIRGRNLADVANERPVEPRQAATYLQAIAEAIEHAHRAGVIHRDLKPSNLLLDVLGQPHVTDFGLAKLIHADAQLTTTGQALGSPNYMAPERARGEAIENEAPGDIYSLGAVLYHLTTGRPPFQAASVQEILTQAQNAEPVPPRRLAPGIPVDLETICLKCLQKEPGKRYSSAQELALDLGRFLADEPIHARPVSGLERLASWRRRRPVQSALAGGLALAILLGVGGVLVEWARAERNAQGEAAARLVAQENAARLRLNLYAADINLAARAYERGDLGRARQTLAGLAPKSGEDDLRGFEWRYLARVVQGEQTAVLTGHDWIVTCAAFSPDGRLLATGSQDGTARLWNMERHELAHLFAGGPRPVWSVAFTPDGSQLMIAGTGRGVEFWNLARFERVGKFDGEVAALSPRGTLMVASQSNPFYWEESGPVTVWNWATGAKVRELARAGRVVAISPDSKTVATAGLMRDIDLWDVATGECLHTLATTQSVWSLEFSPDGDQLASAGWSTEVMLWDWRHQRLTRKLTGHERDVWSALYTADGTEIVTASSDQTIRVWDPATGRTKRILRGHGSEVWCAAITPDGRNLASGGKDRTVRLWNAVSPTTPPVISNRNGSPPVFSPDGKRLLTYGRAGDDWRPQIRSVDSPTPVTTIPTEWGCGFSRDGEAVISLDKEQARLIFWNGDKIKNSVPLEGVAKGMFAVERIGLSIAGETIFIVNSAGTAWIWSVADGKLVGRAHGPKPTLRAAVLGPGGRVFAASVEGENVAHLYDVPTGRALILRGHRDFISGIAFSPDGRQVATGSVDGTVRLWDVATGVEQGSLTGHLNEATDVAYAPDGKTLASIGLRESVILWHLPTLRELMTIPMPRAGMKIAFSPDGRRLAVSTEDDAVDLLEAPPLGATRLEVR